MSSRDPVLMSAGVVLVVSSLAFVAVFTYLAASFGYPDVLDRTAAEVLPALAAGGSTLRNVWFLYGVLPLGIVFAGAASSRGGRTPGALGRAAAVVAGVSMMLGLLRWPTVMTVLAQYWQRGPTSAQPALAAAFDAANLFLGNLIGELVGELALAAWFMVLAYTRRRDGRHVLASLGMVAGVLVAVAALRNMTTAVAVIAEINNVTLPLWLVILGVTFVRDGRGRMAVSEATTRETPRASLPSSA